MGNKGEGGGDKKVKRNEPIRGGRGGRTTKEKELFLKLEKNDHLAREGGG